MTGSVTFFGPTRKTCSGLCSSEKEKGGERGREYVGGRKEEGETRRRGRRREKEREEEGEGGGEEKESGVMR